MKLINTYLSERKQRVKINDQFSSWLDIIGAVPQGSILRPLLFNLFLCNMFLFCNDINFASDADDNTLHIKNSRGGKVNYRNPQNPFLNRLGVTFDNQLNFHHHISKICKTASNKLDALARVSHYIHEDKRRILFNSYLSSQFNYCPVIWINQ